MVILAAACAMVLSLALIYSFAAYATGDEYCFAPIRLSAIANANAYYSSGSGRWIGIFLYSFIVAGANLSRYHLLILLAFPLWFCGFYIIARGVMRGCSAAQCAAAALLMLAVHWSFSPGTYYWLASSVIYGAAFALAALSAVALSRRKIVLAAALAFAAGLANELASVLLIVGTAGMAARAYFRGQPSKPFLFVLAGAAAALAIALVSPGNAVRLSEQADSGRLLVWYAVRPYKSLLAMVGDPRLLGMTALVFTLPNTDPAPRRDWWFPPALALFACLLAIIALMWVTRIAPEDRVLSFLFAGLMGTWFATAWSMRGLVTPAFPAAAIVLSLFLVTSPIVAAILQDARYIPAWREQNLDRWRVLSEAQPGTDVILPPFTHVPPELKDADLIAADPLRWSNQCVARYFGIRSVRQTQVTTAPE